MDSRSLSKSIMMIRSPGKISALLALVLVLIMDAGQAYALLHEETAENEVRGRAVESFQNLVLPMLRVKCFGCHGEGDKLEAMLDLTTREAMIRGGDGGPALEPGDPGASSLYEVVTRESFPVMPPKEANALTLEELDALRSWIEAGAPWPEVSPAPDWTTTEADIWSFRPVRKPEVPVQGIDLEQVRTPIDAFLLRDLTAKGLQLAPPASRLSLIRRVTFDLTGLPPTPEEVEAFLDDPAPNPEAFDKVIDRLLDSPRYGERWGRHWLDVVRYADTSGYSNDFARPHAWRYRDYVIRSFNTDKPYDRFLLEQLAGDEIDPEDPELAVAVGFLRMGPWEHTGMSVAAETRQLFLDDVTHNTVNSFLGLTMGCAKCHDHKFDPLPTRDYYGLQAVFATTQFADRPATFLATENAHVSPQSQARIQDQIRFNEKRLAEIKRKSAEAVEALLKEHGAEKVEDLPEAIRPRDNRYGLTDSDQERERIYRKGIELLKAESKRVEPLAFSVENGSPDPDAVHILANGALDAPGDLVEPGLLGALLEIGEMERSADSSWSVPESQDGRRLALARWIASPDNPLTARVMVNRIWQHHFGKGLVASSNNFGKMGQRPTHPELLDWLASEFVDQGWSVKTMHRLIVRSAAYQQAGSPANPETIAELDPENQLLSYFPSRRLTAEELRDAILAVSGELNLNAGGPPSFPEINRDIALQPRQIMGTVAPAYRESPTRAERHRRTIYTVQMRNLPNPLLEVFNAADMNNSCEARDASTVAPQVFALFNGQFPHDMALAMARRLETWADDLPGQIEAGFRLAYGRPPTVEEAQFSRKHVDSMLQYHRQFDPVRKEVPDQIVRHHVAELSGAPFSFVESWDQGEHEPNLQPADVSPETRALAELCLVLLNSNEFAFVD
ncbi:PSD1 and planctomycete cytochrome C domain-containing protein [soil metagenome]